jgi:hypothetical protein
MLGFVVYYINANAIDLHHKILINYLTLFTSYCNGKKNMLGLAKLDKKKIRRKGRHSKKHKKAKFSRGQGKPI